jgi:hypothetical protein
LRISRFPEQVATVRLFASRGLFNCGLRILDCGLKEKYGLSRPCGKAQGSQKTLTIYQIRISRAKPLKRSSTAGRTKRQERQAGQVNKGGWMNGQVCFTRLLPRSFLDRCPGPRARCKPCPQALGRRPEVPLSIFAFLAFYPPRSLGLPAYQHADNNPILSWRSCERAIQ